MFCRWAAVSLTLLAVTGAELFSTREVQPVPNSTAIAASVAAREALSEQRRARPERRALFPMIVCRQPLLVPPAAAQRLKHRRRVGVAAGLSLHQANARLLIGLLGTKQRK